MAIYYKEFEQRSAAWYKVRAAIPTASSFHKIVTPTGKASSQAEGYMAWLLAEFMLGRPIDDEGQTYWMQRGEELEPMAIDAYTFQTGNETEVCAFTTTDDGLIGCSVDRLVGNEGIAEIKAPSPAVHMSNLLHQDLSDSHKCQLQGQLWVTERKWVDIVSFHPEMPPVIIRVDRNEAYIETLSRGIRTFVDVMLARRQELEDKYGPFVRPVEPEPAISPYAITDEDVDSYLAIVAKRGKK